MVAVFGRGSKADRSEAEEGRSESDRNGAERSEAIGMGRIPIIPPASTIHNGWEVIRRDGFLCFWVRYVFATRKGADL